MHGYNNSEKDMHPFLVAMGPDIAPKGKVPLFYQLDIYPFVCMLLDIYKPNRVDGDVNRVLQFLKTPPSQANLDQFIKYATGSPAMTAQFSVMLNVFLMALVHKLLY